MHRQNCPSKMHDISQNSIPHGTVTQRSNHVDLNRPLLGLATILVKPDAFQSRRRRDLFVPSPVLSTCAATTGQLSKASVGLKTPSLTASSWRSLQGHNCGATPSNPNKQTHRTTSKAPIRKATQHPASLWPLLWHESGATSHQQAEQRHLADPIL
jgi:hypothetical protein